MRKTTTNDEAITGYRDERGGRFSVAAYPPTPLARTAAKAEDSAKGDDAPKGGWYSSHLQD